jgi:RNA polymerase sigma factor FliA
MAKSIATPEAAGQDACGVVVEKHLGLVHHVARKLAKALANDADIDELVSAGSIGLLNAAASFDPSRGLAFSTFAAPRIRGAMLDELRRQDHVSRSVRRKARALAAAGEALARRLEREPASTEVAEHLEIDLETYHGWRSATENALQDSLDQPAGSTEGARLSDLIADSEARSIDAMVEHEEMAAALRAALLDLPERERTILSLYYYEDLKLSEIARLMQVTESRISQIRSKALAQLREVINPDFALAAA